MTATVPPAAAHGIAVPRRASALGRCESVWTAGRRVGERRRVPHIVEGSRCGNRNYGHRHIFDNHHSEFAQKRHSLTSDRREVTDIGMTASINNSVVTKHRLSDDSTCYSRKLFLVNLQSQQTVGSVIVRTVVGNRSNNVVTAFPSSGYCTGSE